MNDLEALLRRVLAPVEQELIALRQQDIPALQRELAQLRRVLQPPSPRARVGGTLAEMEQRLIRQTLHACGGNHSRAALALGIGRKTLYDKIKRYSLKAGAKE